MKWSYRYGLMRSWLMYYAKPFNRRRLKNFYHQFLKPGNLAFDIGAHLGIRSRAWLDLGVRVIAIEPQPVCIDFLQHRFGSDPLFTLVPIAIGKEEANLEFKISRLNPTISTGRGEEWQKKINAYNAIKASWQETITVKQNTLDQLISWYGIPQFCKIDTEGFEWEVLQGLHHPIPQLSIEFLGFDKQRVIWCIERLKELGNYVLNFSFGESQQFYWPSWHSPDEVIAFLLEDRYPHHFGDIYFQLN